MLYKCKKMWQGRVSVRSYLVEYCQKMKEPLVIEFEGKRMKVKDLKDYACDERPQIAQRSDKYIKRGETYHLYDFEFIPEEPTPLDYTKEGLSSLLKAWKALKKPKQLSLDNDKK
jgi:hypothetical protein